MSETHDFGWATMQSARWSQRVRQCRWEPHRWIYYNCHAGWEGEDGEPWYALVNDCTADWQLYTEPKPKPEAIEVQPVRSETPEVPPIDRWIVYWRTQTEWRTTECADRRDARGTYQDRDEDGYPVRLFHLTDQKD